MKSLIQLVILFTSILILSACAAKKELADLKLIHKEQMEVIDRCEQEVESLSSEVTSLQQQKESLEYERDQWMEKVAAAKESIKGISEQEPECPEEMEKGIVFKVQIGAFEKSGISEEFAEPGKVDLEQKGDLQKIVVGQFRAYQKAKELKEQLKGMGLKDAWVVSYKDGERIPIEAAFLELGIQE